MKKIYQIPTVTVVKIQTVHMIAESIGIGANYNGSADIQSRSAGFFDEDEE